MKKIKFISLFTAIMLIISLLAFTASCAGNSKISITLPETFKASGDNNEALSVFSDSNGNVIKLCYAEVECNDYLVGYEDYSEYSPFTDDYVADYNISAEAFTGYQIISIKEKVTPIGGINYWETVYGLVSLYDGSKAVAVEFATYSLNEEYYITVFSKSESLSDELKAIVATAKLSDEFIAGYKQALAEYESYYDDYYSEDYYDAYDDEYNYYEDFSDYYYDEDYDDFNIEDFFNGELGDHAVYGETLSVFMIAFGCVMGVILLFTIIQDAVVLIIMLKYNKRDEEIKKQVALGISQLYGKSFEPFKEYEGENGAI